MTNERLFADSPESVGIDSSKLEALFERAEKEVAEGLLPSSQIAVARNGKIAGMRTVGTVRHHGKEALATNETLYCIFSSTKAITSAAAWLLIQEGKLDVDEIVADIIPEFGTNGKETIRVERCSSSRNRCTPDVRTRFDFQWTRVLPVTTASFRCP